MNFDFSDEQHALREHSRRFLAGACDFAGLRRLIDSEDLYDRALWQQMIELGWTAITLPEDCGGMGLGALELCVLVEEAGRALAPVPFFSTVCVGAELLKQCDHPRRDELLGAIAAGEAIIAADLVNPAIEVDSQGLATGTIAALAWGAIANHAIVTGNGPNEIIVALVDLATVGVRVGAAEFPFDELLPVSELNLQGARVSLLAEGAQAQALIERIINQCAVLTAFEQIGGAEVACDMARNYALERHVFGRPLATYQAVKHKLADALVQIELARSNAYFGAWAMQQQAELPLAAALARVSATEAFNFAAEENLQVHGGIGYTWEADCHFFYKRARLLANNLGHFGSWCERLLAASAAGSA